MLSLFFLFYWRFCWMIFSIKLPKCQYVKFVHRRFKIANYVKFVNMSYKSPNMHSLCI